MSVFFAIQRQKIIFSCLLMAYEIQNKKSGFYHLFEFKVAPEVLLAFETEFRRDERVMRFLTVTMDKHAISWAERRRTKLKAAKA